MKMDCESVIKLEEILFKSERMGAVLDCLQMMIGEGAVEVCGIPENALNYSLYEICEGCLLYTSQKNTGAHIW